MGLATSSKRVWDSQQIKTILGLGGPSRSPRACRNSTNTTAAGYLISMLVFRRRTAANVVAIGTAVAIVFTPLHCCVLPLGECVVVLHLSTIPMAQSCWTPQWPPLGLQANWWCVLYEDSAPHTCKGKFQKAGVSNMKMSEEV